MVKPSQATHLSCTGAIKPLVHPGPLLLVVPQSACQQFHDPEVSQRTRVPGPSRSCPAMFPRRPSRNHSKLFKSSVKSGSRALPKPPSDFGIPKRNGQVLESSHGHALSPDTATWEARPSAKRRVGWKSCAAGTWVKASRSKWPLGDDFQSKWG